ncbi:hypothetical protein [Embleya scabrispora]|uniref:hypothetical protein n=1 Tax=Embleya scabrispora TaxID=159449 RepID=UPI000361357B|nr:hypothetical protein [Embleya scabrispora]MYS85042.1 hypothetical protein [Streptomyces sp. SID5474]
MSQHRQDHAADTGCGCDGGADAAPAPPVRNRFYPGKLMDVRHWNLEQGYHRRTAATLARLGLGPGVLCGLDAELADDGAVTICPGAAVDGHGRLIVVDHPVRIDEPYQPTDCAGAPRGEPVREGTVAIRLCRHECGTEFVRMPVVDCEVREECVPSLTLERFLIRITEGEPDPVGLTEEQCAAIFPARRGEDFDRREQVADTVEHECGCDDDCLVLATVTYEPEQEPDLDAVTARPVVYSNRVLFDLLMCLAERVDRCCAGHTFAPRITALWPQVGAAATAATWRAFVADKRMEIAFDRPLVDAAFDAPNPWLGLWQLDHTGVRRLKLSRTGGAFTRITVPPGGEGVAYAVELEGNGLLTSTVFVVGLRVPVSGPPKAQGPDGSALDPDLVGTGLTVADRDALWALNPGGAKDTGLAALVDRAPLAAVPPFPSGNGTQGGELHVFTPPPPPTARGAAGPRLLRVWPPGGSRLDAAGALRREWTRFVRTPHVELTVDRALADAATAEPGGWVRLFQAQREGDRLVGFRRLELGPGAPKRSDADPESVTYVFEAAGARLPVEGEPAGEFLLQVRVSAANAALVVGAEEPAPALDADFAGTGLDNHTLFSIWSGQQTLSPSLPVSALGARSSVDVDLFDGDPGGFVHLAFEVASE